MTHRAQLFSRQSGLSLIEVMVAAFIGMLILGVVGSLYLANRNIMRFQEAYSRIQETGRYVTDLFGRDVRNATYTGCGPLSSMSNIIHDSSTAWWLNSNRMVWGYEQGSAKPVEFDGALADSDVLIVMYRSVAGEGMLANHDMANNRFTLSQNHVYPKGSVLMISDCSRSGVIRMSGPAGAAGTTNVVEYNSGALGGSHDNDPAAVLTPVRFGTGAFISPMVTNAYYVMSSDDAVFTTNPCPSNDSSYVRRVLVSRSLAGSTDGNTKIPTPVACDVHSLQVRYGVDNDGDRAADSFQKASALGINELLWQNVVSVRIDFLVVNPKVNAQTSDVIYCLDYNGGANPGACPEPGAAGAAYDYIWKSDAAQGRRIGKSFSTVFSFRNRTS